MSPVPLPSAGVICYRSDEGDSTSVKTSLELEIFIVTASEFLRACLMDLCAFDHKIAGISACTTASQCALYAVNSLRINNLEAITRNLASVLKRVKTFLHKHLSP
jgi:hypothetical protein